MKTILLADDHPLVRGGLKIFIKEFMNDTEIHEAGNGDDMLAKLSENIYDIIIMDIRMPGTDALEIIQFIRTRYPDIKVLIFSMSSEETHGCRFLKAGVKGFVSKDAALDELKNAIHLILNGRIYLSTKLKEILARDSLSDNPLNPFNKLSTREYEVSSRLLSGECLNKISRSLNLRPSTVGTHKSRIFEKLKVENILDLKELADLYKV